MGASWRRGERELQRSVHTHRTRVMDTGYTPLTSSVAESLSLNGTKVPREGTPLDSAGAPSLPASVTALL
jgi:hypothetical protein